MNTISRKLSSGLVAISIILTCFSSITNAATIVLKATEDSSILDGNNMTNSSGDLGSELDTSGEGSIWISVLKFDLSSLAGMSVQNATFELTSFSNHNPNSFTHEVFSSSDNSWTEETITGINRPLDSTLTLLDWTDINGNPQTYSWGVLAGVTGTDGLSGGNNFLTLLIRPELSQAGSGGFGPHFFDRKELLHFPALVVTTNPVPIPTTIWLLGSSLIALFSMRTKLNR